MAGRSKQGRDAMGVGLAALNRVASLRVIDRLNLRKPAERVVYQASRTGFKAVGAANRTFTAVSKRGTPERPGTADERALFDLTPTAEQQMIVAPPQEFAPAHPRPPPPRPTPPRAPPPHLPHPRP